MILPVALVFAIICHNLQTSTEAACLQEAQCATCDQHGFCETECYDGFYSHQCTLPCSPNCRNRKCKLLEDRGIEKCTDGCLPGFEGTRCAVEIVCEQPNDTCSKCPSECEGDLCMTTSKCIRGCNQSYFGKNCKSCSSNCELCDRISGTCNRCKPDWGGPECQHSCTHCDGHCGTVECNGPCKNGYFGLFCTQSCSSNCKDISSGKELPSENISRCEKSDGGCIHGCEEGWGGIQCSVECGVECRNSKCSQDGMCTDGCTSGYFGRECQPCPVNCQDKLCETNNGICHRGCNTGFYGPACNVTCAGCTFGRCNQASGICLAGCWPSYYGERCNVFCQDANSCVFTSGRRDIIYLMESGFISNSTFLAIGLALLILLCTIIGLLSAHICRRQRRMKTMEKTTAGVLEEEKTPLSCVIKGDVFSNIYSEINEANLDTGVHLDWEKRMCGLTALDKALLLRYPSEVTPDDIEPEETDHFQYLTPISE